MCILRKKDALADHFLQRGIKIKFFGQGKFNPFTLISLIKVIRREKIHVMHVQGYGALTFGRLARILTGVPILVHFHDTSLYYPWVQRVADRVLARFTDAGLAVSNSVKKFWIEKKRVPGLNPDKIKVMHNCVCLDEFTIPDPEQIEIEKKRWGLNPDTKIVGTVTRLFESKGNRYILEAAVEILRTFPDTVFIIVGDGPRRSHLEDLARRLGIAEKVIFTGFRTHVEKLLGIFDVMVFSSWGADGGSPLTVLEAMTMGKPIVATDMVEIVDDGISALLVSPKDSQDIAQKVLSLLQDGDLARNLGDNAREQSQRFDAAIYVRHLEEIYEQLARGIFEESADKVDARCSE
jgi:glycosyltransferase involved in cell wall biosynthesis